MRVSRARWLAKELAPPLAGVVGVIPIWAIVSAVTDSTAIPSPSTVWSAFLAGMRDGTLPDAAVKTLIRLAFSFVVAVAFGTALGLALALNEFARRAIRPLIVALQITPFVAWVPLAVIWFGATERAVVFVAIVGSFPAMTLATIQAIRNVPPLYERTGRTLGARGWTLYRSIVFPAAMPGVMAGLQQAWGFAWKALMAGELMVVGGPREHDTSFRTAWSLLRRNRDFRKLYLASLISYGGDWFLFVALGGLIFQATGKATSVAFFLVAQ